MLVASRTILVVPHERAKRASVGIYSPGVPGRPTARLHSEHLEEILTRLEGRDPDRIADLVDEIELRPPPDRCVLENVRERAIVGKVDQESGSRSRFFS